MNIQDTIRIKKSYAKVDKGSSFNNSYENSLALLFQENTKIDRLLLRRHGEQIQQFDSEYYRQRSSMPYKVYSDHEQTSLSTYRNMGAPRADFFDLLKARQSIRQFVPYQLSLRELFCLCHFAYGISRTMPASETTPEINFRYVPSGGGLYPLELYVVVLNGLPKPGLYHYRPDIETLEHLQSGLFLNRMRDFISAEPYIELEHVSCIFLITSVIERTLIKYGDRGYRWILMEVGFVTQNMSLIASALGLGSCLAGGFLDEEVNHFVGIDGVSETIQKAIVIGKPIEGY
jgi:SagB-type dehydrogenase family enzyme